MYVTRGMKTAGKLDRGLAGGKRGRKRKLRRWRGAETRGTITSEPRCPCVMTPVQWPHTTETQRKGDRVDEQTSCCGNFLHWESLCGRGVLKGGSKDQQHQQAVGFPGKRSPDQASFETDLASSTITNQSILSNEKRKAPRFLSLGGRGNCGHGRNHRERRGDLPMETWTYFKRSNYANYIKDLILWDISLLKNNIETTFGEVAKKKSYFQMPFLCCWMQSGKYFFYHFFKKDFVWKAHGCYLKK